MFIIGIDLLFFNDGMSSRETIQCSSFLPLLIINQRTIECNSEMIILGVVARLVGTLLCQKTLAILVQRCRKFQLGHAGITGAPPQLNAY